MKQKTISSFNSLLELQKAIPSSTKNILAIILPLRFRTVKRRKVETEKSKRKKEIETALSLSIIYLQCSWVYLSTEVVVFRETAKLFNSTVRLQLRKLCWETMYGQELVKLIIMDTVSDYHGHG